MTYEEKSAHDSYRAAAIYAERRAHRELMRGAESVQRIVTVFVVAVLIVHGLIHFMAAAIYGKSAHMKGLTYTSTLFNWRWNLGEGGIQIFGALWMLPAIGFLAAALALLARWEWWKPVLIGVTILSLVLTALDWNHAFTVAIVDIFILAVVLLRRRIVAWFS